MTKFAFKNSYEENVIKLHKEIIDGKIAIVDGFIPSKGMKILAKGLRFQPLPTVSSSNNALVGGVSSSNTVLFGGGIRM